MKHVLFTTFLSLNSCLLMAQFSPAIFIDTLEMESFTQIAAGDFTNDGQVDLLTSTATSYGHMRLYTRTGETQFVNQLLPGMPATAEFYFFDIGDINNDGWMDFVLSFGPDYAIYWYENNAGNFTPHVIDSALAFVDKVMLRDFNNDGKLDLLSMQQFELVTYMALTPGVFDTAQVVDGNNDFYAIDIADYDGNGTPDISGGGIGNDVLLNDGSGNFTLQSQQNINFVFGLESGDLDGDLDIDLAIGNPQINRLLAYKNDGEGNFQLYDTILTQPGSSLSQMADLDCDGDQDILISLSQTNEIAWLENDGNAEFPAFHQIYAASLIDPVSNVADMNADGIPDIIWAGRHLAMHLSECGAASLTETSPETLTIWPNPSGGNFTIGNTGDHVLEVQLTDMMGRTVFSGVIAANTSLIITVPQAGVYALNSISADGRLVVAKRLIRY